MPINDSKNTMFLENKTVLITGAGRIGAASARLAIDLLLILTDICEQRLLKLKDELQSCSRQNIHHTM